MCKARSKLRMFVKQQPQHGHRKVKSRTESWVIKRLQIDGLHYVTRPVCMWLCI